MEAGCTRGLSPSPGSSAAPWLPELPQFEARQQAFVPTSATFGGPLWQGCNLGLGQSSGTRLNKDP